MTRKSELGFSRVRMMLSERPCEIQKIKKFNNETKMRENRPLGLYHELH